MSTKNFIMLIIGLSFMFFYSHLESSQTNKNYKVLNKEVYDVPLKTQVTMHVLYKDKLTKVGVDNFLKTLYQEINKSSGYKYHTHPTHIGIYVYDTEEVYRQDASQWVGMLIKLGENDDYKITIDNALTKNHKAVNKTESKKSSNEILGQWEFDWFVKPWLFHIEFLCRMVDWDT